MTTPDRIFDQIHLYTATQLGAGSMPSNRRPKETDFHEITLYVTDAELNELRLTLDNEHTTGAEWLRDRLEDALPLPPIVVEEGMAYGYENGNEYEVTQVADSWAILRRLNGNARGPEGSRFPERIEKIRADLESGRAQLLDDEEDGE